MCLGHLDFTFDIELKRALAWDPLQFHKNNYSVKDKCGIYDDEKKPFS